MPGRGSYGPGGKWIYTRAKKLRAKNPDMDESTSFAIATQQAHKVNKSPKGFRTPQGVATAKAKMSGPVKEYRKTASSQEWNEIYQAGVALGDDYRRMRKGLSSAEGRRYRKAVLGQMKALPMRQPRPGELATPEIHDYRTMTVPTPEELGIRKTAGAEEAMAKRLKTLCSLRDKGYTSDRENREISWLRDQLGEGGSVKTAALAGFFDELEKAASLAAAARFGVGVLLGSMLWNSMGSEEKQELKERAQEVVGERREKIALATPPIGEEQKKVKLPQFLQPMRYSEKGLMGNRKRAPTFKAKAPPKPPPPNIQSVATKIRKP